MTSKPRALTRTTALVASIACLLLGSRGVPAAPLTLLDQWEGGMDYFATGAPLAVNGGGEPNNVDVLSQPASVVVGVGDVPATASVVAAHLWWAGTIPDQNECASTQYTDDEVKLTLPGAAVPVTITADACQCVAGATSYDIQACRKDITSLVVVSGMHGTFTLDEFAAQVEDGTTDNASFSLVLVYEEADLLPPRRIALYDGLEELYQGSRIMQLGGLDVDNPAHGEITWYVLDGDLGGTGPEEVVVQGQPGGVPLTVSDAINPVDNPMNRTINTTQPAQTGVLGIDIDRLDVSLAMTPGDTALDMTYTAGGDKFWVVYNLVGVNVYRPVIHPKQSSKTWTLGVDADSSGTVTEGDTVRYTIHLVNAGTAPGYVSITDPIPTEFSSWTLVDGAGGTDQSTTTQLVLVNLWLTVGGTLDVILDAVIGPGSAGMDIVNAVRWETVSTGTQGTIVGIPVQVAGGSGPDAGVPDAALPDGALPDAALIDAAIPDASPGSDAGPDAGPDAAVQPDAEPGPDSGGPHVTSPDGCGCQGTPGRGDLPVGALILLGLLIVVRRTRLGS